MATGQLEKSLSYCVNACELRRSERALTCPMFQNKTSGGRGHVRPRGQRGPVRRRQFERPSNPGTGPKADVYETRTWQYSPGTITKNFFALTGRTINRNMILTFGPCILVPANEGEVRTLGCYFHFATITISTRLRDSKMHGYGVHA